MEATITGSLNETEWQSDSWRFCRDHLKDEKFHSSNDNEEVDARRERSRRRSLSRHHHSSVPEDESTLQESKHYKLQTWWGEPIIYRRFKFVSGLIVFSSLRWSAERWNLSSRPGPVISVSPADVSSTTAELGAVTDYAALLGIFGIPWKSRGNKQLAELMWIQFHGNVHPGHPQFLLDLPHTRSLAEPHSRSGYSQMWTKLSSYPSLQGPRRILTVNVLSHSGQRTLQLDIGWLGLPCGILKLFRLSGLLCDLSSINHNEVRMTYMLFIWKTFWDLI